MQDHDRHTLDFAFKDRNIGEFDAAMQFRTTTVFDQPSFVGMILAGGTKPGIGWRKANRDRDQLPRRLLWKHFLAKPKLLLQQALGLADRFGVLLSKGIAGPYRKAFDNGGRVAGNVCGGGLRCRAPSRFLAWSSVFGYRHATGCGRQHEPQEIADTLDGASYAWRIAHCGR